MKKIFTKEVRIAIITLISLFVLYAGLNYLKGANIFKPTNHYFVKMQNVHELQKSSPIYSNGFKIGIVNQIEYNYNDPGSIVVMISLDNQMRVETDSYFELKSGLTSGAFLDLKLNKDVTSYCEPGDTLTAISEPGMMDKLAKNMLPQIEELLPRLDSILAGIQVIVNHPALIESLDNIAASTNQLKQTTNQLNSMLARDVPGILKNIEQVSEDFTAISGNLKQLEINKTMAAVDKTLENIDQMTQQLNNKDNSLGLLLNDNSLYIHLDSTAANASALLKDLKENPKRYVHFSIF